jgi:predicted ABC-type ATPase
LKSFIARVTSYDDISSRDWLTGFCRCAFSGGVAVALHNELMPTPPQAVIIAGPNGSGKSTCATMLLPPDMTFINADQIAQEQTGKKGTTADIGAGRVLLRRMDELVAEGEDFAIETTLATKTLADRVHSLRKRGYQTHLVFFWLPSDDLAVERVAARVRDGGHPVPEETIRRRFKKGLRHFFETYSPLVDTWRMYDNSDGQGPKLIAKGAGQELEVQQPEQWNQMHKGDAK